MGEKFAANPVTGTGSLTIPIAVSPGRSGFGPQLALSYDSGAGNGPFGLGWSLSLPAITRKTEKGLPLYRDAEESDVFVLSGAEDLVPTLVERDGQWQRDGFTRVAGSIEYRIQRYRPRVEGLFARIERWTDTRTGDAHWRSISRENITTLYGRSEESRLTDPADPHRVFSWLICESWDDKGNAVRYVYQTENSEGVETTGIRERNRTVASRAAARYLKRILYGNRTPREAGEDVATRTDWMFEAVFDYGEHYREHPSGQPVFVSFAGEFGAWPVREDPFSSYRAGFELRTYRLCRRVLMFHHFPSELGVPNYLVRATHFQYTETPIASFMTSVTQSAYRRSSDDTYFRRSLPPVELEYTQAVIQEEVREIDAASLQNLPHGLDGTRYEWVDLDGEGVSGVLAKDADAWYYKSNAGDGRLAAVRKVSLTPSTSESRHQLLDLASDGQLDLVHFGSTVTGFYERSSEGSWARFSSFESIPQITWDDPNLKFIDLTGDGHADILITEENAWTWYPSLAEHGFGPPSKIRQPGDEERGPRLVFADATQSMYVADMSGDGLTDIVRIRNGEVSYWPNLGYGRFGAKVAMDNGPWFDAPDQFDQRRIRLADIDGSGVTDILYVGRDGVRIYFNESGNAWSAVRVLTSFPRVDNLSALTVADLLGNGTACLVWSSPLPGDARRPIRFVDLMGGQKPHLLTRAVNNLGAETVIHYAPSTRFYLADAQAGRPWITRLPFPVHVVDRVETFDRISRNRFVTQYSYHHGYFDGTEREFRGFGMVEQWDTEEFAARGDNIAASSHVPPVLTRTWFHTGAWFDEAVISRHFESEYYHEPGLSDAEANARVLPDTVLPSGLTLDEERQACRSLKGATLRSEIYALDGTPESVHPYSVTEQNYSVKLLQPQGGNRHAVFHTHGRESLAFHYERHPSDPRTGHELVLDVDEFGNVLRSVSVAYGRRSPDMALSVDDREKQTRLHITSTENVFTNPVLQVVGDPTLEDDRYRTPLPAETRTYEILKAAPAGAAPQRPALFGWDEIRVRLDEAGDRRHDVPYEDVEAPGATEDHPYRRLLEHVRTIYRRDDLAGPLALRQLESLALPHESYKLAFTPGLISQVYGTRVTDEMLASEGRYNHVDGDANWWIPSGRQFFSLSGNDTAEQELTAARAGFFLARRTRDPFGESATIDYDVHDLLPVASRDPLGNTTAAEYDYRVLQPRLVTDANGNRAEVAFDTLGMVVGTAVMGKVSEDNGDSVAGLNVDPDEATIGNHLLNPQSNPHAMLRTATTRLVYDVSAYFRTRNDAQPQPAAVYVLAREIHAADPAGARTKVQHSFSYSDGFGREIQKKIQAEPGPLVENGPDTNPRWVGSGWTIFNNKGKPVRQYEPFFTPTHTFEFARAEGVSSVLFYDPVERVIATLHPNHTWEKVVFDPWRQEIWDVNDTVLLDPKNDPDAGAFFRRLADADYLPTWHEQRSSGALGTAEHSAATKAAAHASTPAVSWLDTLGRPFLAVAHNRVRRNGEVVEELYATRTTLDIEGNQRAVIDAKDRVVMRYAYDLLGNRIHQASMEAGERWTLNDVAGKPLYAWDSRAHQFRTAYDQLRRPTESFLREGNGPEQLVGRSVYGDTQPNPEARNLRGKVVQLFDQAGLVSTHDYDFKGNLVSSQRQLAREYKSTLDWSAAVPLEGPTYTSRTRYDALNRPTELTAPDGSVIRPSYNEANLLERVETNLRGAAVATAFVADIDYDAKGQRTRIAYGNGVTTTYEYDPLTFRLVHLLTRRDSIAFPDDCPQPAPTGSPGCAVQNLRYTYDPLGNITAIRDEAQQTIYFRNRRVEPSADYSCDAIYRLIEATGREHLGQNGGSPNPPTSPDAFNGLQARLDHPGDGLAMGTYVERYLYDAVGNILAMQHRGSDPDHPGWTRTYAYGEASQVEDGAVSNRLSRTAVGEITESYRYDGVASLHGNITAMPHLPFMQWDYRDQLQATAQQVVDGGATAEITWYVYDAGGQRVRKVTERQAAAGQAATRKEERLYLGGVEIYREYQNDGTTVALERETLHIVDDKQRIALVETRTAGSDSSPVQLVRYQVVNHLGSASLELDDRAQIISYEEYYPYGSTSYQAARGQIETPKRYRYTGKERDEETGLYYHGARYYAPWLARWASADPKVLVDGVNLYAYSRNNPLRFMDPNGTQSVPIDLHKISELNAAATDEQVGREQQQQHDELIDDDLRKTEDAESAEQQQREDIRRVNRGAALYTGPPGILATEIGEFAGGVLTGEVGLSDMSPAYSVPGVGGALMSGQRFEEAATKAATANDLAVQGDLAGASRASFDSVYSAMSGLTYAAATRLGFPGFATVPKQRGTTPRGEGASGPPRARTPQEALPEVNTGSSAVNTKNCGDCAGAVGLGDAKGSTAFAERAGLVEGGHYIPDLHAGVDIAGGKPGPLTSAPSPRRLAAALGTYPAGTNFMVFYVGKPGAAHGHVVNGLVGKNKQLLYVDLQPGVARPRTWIPGSAIDIWFFEVTPLPR